MKKFLAATLAAAALALPMSATIVEPAQAAGCMNKVLKKGADKACIERLQDVLNHSGYKAGPVDGKYGDKTSAAVRRVQDEFHLSRDGIAGPKTNGVICSKLRDRYNGFIRHGDDELRGYGRDGIAKLNTFC